MLTSHPGTVVWSPNRGKQSPQKHGPLCLWWAAALARGSTSRPSSWWSFPHGDPLKTKVSREHQHRLATKGSSRSTWTTTRASGTKMILLVFSTWTLTCWPVVPETWGWECPAGSWAHSSGSLYRGAAGWELPGRSVIRLGLRSPAFPSTTIPEKS